MKAIADSLDVSRSNLAERATRGRRPRGPYQRADDPEMLEAVEKRFGTVRATHPIEWLSDNGSPDTAKETREFAGPLNLTPCFTPVRSPESNGLAEAFVKTFKRDDVRVTPISHAETVLPLLDGWFEDYNTNHPHSRLSLRSPREFIRAMSETAVRPI